MLKKLKILVEIENGEIQVQLQEHRIHNYDVLDITHINDNEIVDITHVDTTEDIVAAVKNYLELTENLTTMKNI